MPEQVTCSIAVICDADANRRAAMLRSGRMLRDYYHLGTLWKSTTAERKKSEESQ